MLIDDLLRQIDGDWRDELYAQELDDITPLSQKDYEMWDTIPEEAYDQ